MRFDSESAGFDPMELQLGESRSVVGEDGSIVFIVRTEDGFDIEANGRRVSVPAPESVVARVREAGEHEDMQIMRHVVVEREAGGEAHEIHVSGDVDVVHEMEFEVHIVNPEVDDTN